MKSATKEMYRNLWEQNHRSVCSIKMVGNSGGKLFGVSGFRAGDYIITDTVVYNTKDVQTVHICFFQNDGLTTFREIVFELEDFMNLLPSRSETEKVGATFFKLNSEQLKDIPKLELCSRCNSKIGLETAIIGYQFTHDNLGIKSCMISAYTSDDNGLSYIQYDGNSRIGESGSPLLDLETGQVLGIVAQRKQRIAKVYTEIQRIADNNLEILKKLKGKWTFEDIDPVQVMQVSQNQIKHLSKEFFNNFAVRIGYALEINNLRDMFDTYGELNSDENN